MNPKMLDRAIAKFTKADPAVKKPAADLLALLSGLPESKTPKTPLSKDSAEAANKELGALSDPRNVDAERAAAVDAEAGHLGAKESIKWEARLACGGRSGHSPLLVACSAHWTRAVTRPCACGG